MVCLPIQSCSIRVSYQLNYFLIRYVFVVTYVFIPTLMLAMIIAIIPIKFHQMNCFHEQPQMQIQDSRAWKL